MKRIIAHIRPERLAGAAIFFARTKRSRLCAREKTGQKDLCITGHGQDAYASFQFFSNI